MLNFIQQLIKVMRPMHNLYLQRRMSLQQGSEYSQHATPQLINECKANRKETSLNNGAGMRVYKIRPKEQYISIKA